MFLFCLSGCHFPHTLFIQAEAVVMSEPLTIRGGKKKTVKTLDLETAAASSAVFALCGASEQMTLRL